MDREPDRYTFYVEQMWVGEYRVDAHSRSEARAKFVERMAHERPDAWGVKPGTVPTLVKFKITERGEVEREVSPEIELMARGNFMREEKLMRADDVMEAKWTQIGITRRNGYRRYAEYILEGLQRGGLRVELIQPARCNASTQIVTTYADEPPKKARKARKARKIR